MNMNQDEDIQIVGTTSDSLVQKLTDEKYGQEFAEAYLEADFLASSANALFHIRRTAGLTQAEVAERLNTKQSAIALLPERVLDYSEITTKYPFSLDAVIGCHRESCVTTSCEKTFRQYVRGLARSAIRLVVEDVMRQQFDLFPPFITDFPWPRS